jgi:hypothetical protein
MTDVYVAYARQDRDRLRVVGELLRAEGWDSWMDPAEPKPDLSPIADLKLGWSKAVLVLWSDSARRSEYVRSEAATGLYKNKLIQARIDGEAPPRPFDELDAVDLSRWNGDPEDPNWRRLTAMLRSCAGDPVKPPAQAAAPKRAAAAVAPPPPKPEPKRPTPPPIEFADPAPAPPRFVESPPPPPKYEPAPPPRAAEPPPPPPRYEPPPPPPQQRFAEPPPPPPQPRYDPPPSPRYAENDTTRYVDRAEPLRGPRLADSVYRVPQERRDERLDEPDLGVRRSSYESGYPRQQRSFAAVPVVAAVALIGSGVGLWLVDPFGWRVEGAPQEQVATGIPVQTVAEATTANAVPATGSFEDTSESAEDWSRVDARDAEALRDHVSAFPRASTAETARSTLRVLDAQAWVKAVTEDSEAAYRVYLAAFPAVGEVPGAMGRAAEERLVSLGAERSQAIEEIQRGLAALQLYDGATTGKADEATTQAMRAFAQSSRAQAPALASATPRELRTFAESIRNTGATPKASAAVSAAAEADRRRIAQAEAQVTSASAARAAGAATTVPGADSLAAAQQSRIDEDLEAWAIAERDGTLAGYRAYLAAYPGGARAANAETLIAKLSRPAPFSVEQLPAETKAVVEAARRAQTTAIQRATAARQAAQSADNLSDGQTITGGNGDRYVAQISGGAPNGLGVRTRGAGPNAGDRYRGELRNGQASGVGVYEFADSPGNASARAARYEGEHSGDAASGHGVMHWKSGDSLAGSGVGGNGAARGVLSYTNGQRYEGEMASGNRQGLGVVWAPDGSVIQAGRWARGELVEPAKP